MATKSGLELLDDVLAAYGSDRKRWPAAVRLELSQLIAASPEAREMLEEAEALDRLIDMAPAMAPARIAALSDRIAAQAMRGPRIVSAKEIAAPPVRPVPAWKRHAAGLSALAASLMIGLFAGQNASVAPAVSELASAVGIESLSDNTKIAATDETYVGLDEDML